MSSNNDEHFEKVKRPGDLRPGEDIEEEQKVAENGDLVDPCVEDGNENSPVNDNWVSLKKPKEKAFAQQIEVIIPRNRSRP